MSDAVAAALQACAEAQGDITASVYERFFSACPEAVALMGHSDDQMRGRMLAQVFDVLLGEGGADVDYLRWEVQNHVVAYSVSPGMYPAFMTALREVVADGCGAAWTKEVAAAWQAREEALLAEIAAV